MSDTTCLCGHSRHRHQSLVGACLNIGCPCKSYRPMQEQDYSDPNTVTLPYERYAQLIETERFYTWLRQHWNDFHMKHTDPDIEVAIKRQMGAQEKQTNG